MRRLVGWIANYHKDPVVLLADGHDEEILFEDGHSFEPPRSTFECGILFLCHFECFDL